MEPRCLLASTLSACLAAALSGQTSSTIPAALQRIPGNAAVSMPLRWSHGVMQVRIDAPLLPAGFVGRTITGLRLRKPAFLREPAYGGLQRTLTVRGGFHASNAWQVGYDLAANRPAGLTVLYGPSPVAIGPTVATGAATDVGADLLDLTFAMPLPVVAGNLFLEFEVGDAPLVVGAEHWVDAVWYANGAETGHAVTVGAGTCTTRAVPTELVWDAATGPAVGGTARLRLGGAPPAAFACAWFGLDPVPRAAGGSYAGYGGSLGALSVGLLGCHQWAPLDATWIGSADAAGTWPVTFQLAASATTIGMRIGVQAAWLDPSRPGTIPLSVSNGVMLVLDRVGTGNRCSTAFFPAGATTSPWFPSIGLMPVVTLVH